MGSSSSAHRYPGQRGSAVRTPTVRANGQTAPTAPTGSLSMPGPTYRTGSLNSAASAPPVAFAPPSQPPPVQQPPLPLTTEAAQTLSRPGAYSISRNAAGPTQVFRVSIPPNVQPGQEFQVYAGTRVVRVRCPPETYPGQSVQITVPPDPIVRPAGVSDAGSIRGMAVITSAEGDGGGGAVRMTDDVARVNATVLQPLTTTPTTQPASAPPSPAPPAPSHATSYMVVVPPGVNPGAQFPVLVNGRQLLVQCPLNAHAGMSVRIVPPPEFLRPPPPPNMQSATDLTLSPEGGSRPPPLPSSASTTQTFEVTVPQGVRPNQPFALFAAGQRVLVTCPPNALPGQRIRFQLSISNAKNTGEVQTIKMNYDTKDGWTRTIRVTDMKFQWVRMDEAGDVDLTKRFDLENSAYVRKLLLLKGNDDRMRTGKLSLVPASEAAVDSVVRNNEGTADIVTNADLAHAQTKSFDDKTKWFQGVCSSLTVDWDEGHIRINVRRQYLLHDSMGAVMSLSRNDLRKIWRFEFMGEMGIDAGGLAKEWFQLVTEAIFNADNGLWLSSAGNQTKMRINPASQVSCPEDHLIYFRFLGRVIGKALFDRRLVGGAHMVQHLYKHILGWPITFNELQIEDEDMYNSLKKMVDMKENGEDLSMLCLDFTATEETLGVKKTVELISDGANVEVNNKNLPEYMEANLKYRMLDRIRPQLTELLLGFFDIIPEPLLTIFDFRELELLMCGLPKIEMDDWMANTLYSGTFDQRGGANHEVCRWFWEVVRDDFDKEMKARLLQFVTATAGVPSRGFSVLQGNDGNIRKFTIHGIDMSVSLFPKAHTCFNRIDLPMYKSKKDLSEKLRIAVTTSSVGFDIE